MQAKKMGIQVVLILLLISCLSSTLAAQLHNKTEKWKVDSLMNELKEGTLVIRLKSYQKSIAQLESVRQNTKTSKKKKNQLQKRIQTIKSDRDRFGKELTAAFHKIYDFSKFRVMYDTASEQLDQGIRKGYFLNEDLAIDPNIELENGAYFILGEGNSVNDSGISVHGLVVLNENNEQLSYPFPKFFNVKHNRNFLSAFLGKSKYDRRSGEKIVSKINKKFNKFGS